MSWKDKYFWKPEDLTKLDLDHLQFCLDGVDGAHSLPRSVFGTFGPVRLSYRKSDKYGDVLEYQLELLHDTLGCDYTVSNSHKYVYFECAWKVGARNWLQVPEKSGWLECRSGKDLMTACNTMMRRYIDFCVRNHINAGRCCILPTPNYNELAEYHAVQFEELHS